VVRYLGPVLTWFEAFARPRWSDLARQERLGGIVCLYLSFLLLLPIPFVNLAPAVCLALIALGLVQRDGICVALGFAGTAVLTVVLVAASFQIAAWFRG
jgi:hypothetical protein